MNNVLEFSHTSYLSVLIAVTQFVEKSAKGTYTVTEKQIQA